MNNLLIGIGTCASNIEATKKNFYAKVRDTFKLLGKEE
jgi:hypothetical protein